VTSPDSSLPGLLTEALAERYALERELGRGGMATVYLAQDLRHHRAVALKVLRPELAAVIGAERFLAEIRTTANLQHPHILPLFDSGAAGALLFYVMPFVEGESLRERLTRERQLPVAEALRIARETASALDYAHKHGVIHRDIKPENILLHDGTALVADFGIALALSSAGGRMTETGMSLGTPYYMSPEQATGERSITARADVYALGAVTYEMLLGEPPFTGPTAQAILAKVMTERPGPITRRRPRVPCALEAVVFTALEKLPADRFTGAGEFAAALDRAAAGGLVPGAAVISSRRRAGWALGITVCALGLGLGGFLLGRRSRPADEPSAPASRLALFAPAVGGSGGAVTGRQLALSPDGTTVVYVAVGADGTDRLLRQRLDEAEATVLPIPDLSNPQISPDGRWLLATLFRATETPSRMLLQGGAPEPLPRKVRPGFGAWAPDGSFWSDRETGIGFDRLVGTDSIEPIAAAPGLRLQQFLDDRTVLVVRRPQGTNSGACLTLDVGSGVTTPLIAEPVVEARYTAGYLVYALPDGTLEAVAFDPRRRQVTGEVVRLAADVSLTGTGIAQFAVAPNGTVVYIPEEPRSLVFVDRSGASRLAVAGRHNYHAPRFSPDGRRVSLDYTTAEGRDVWMLSLDEGTLSRATFGRDGHDATWTPDGRAITYSMVHGGTIGLYRTRPGSAAPPESLFASPKLSYTGLWLPDGSALLTTGVDLRPGSGTDIGVLRNGGRGPLEPLVASPFVDWHPALSSDGRWLAYDSDRSGTAQIYVQPVGSGDEEPVQISQDGGTEPLWGPGGHELFYRRTGSGKDDFMAAELRLGPEVRVTARRALFPIPDIVGASPHVNYDISPDGRTFVMVRRSPATRIVVLQNLPELVRGGRRAGIEPATSR